MAGTPRDPGGWSHHLLVMARVALDAGELSKAQEFLDDGAARMVRFTVGMAAMQARQSAVQAAVREALAAGAHREPLTDRERDVLRLLQGALTVRQIASALYLSSNTVKTHINAVYRKLGTHSRGEAVTIARRDRLI